MEQPQRDSRKIARIKCNLVVIGGMEKNGFYYETQGRDLTF
jgi:hypothetical protein